MPAHVGPTYAHYAKRATPHGRIPIGSSEIKLYHLEKPGEPVPAAIAAAAWDCLAGNALAVSGLEGDLGFAILHRCGADFHFLLIGVWRGSNELWEAVWYRDAGMDGFAPFDPAYPAGSGTLRPTFCVWELGIVGHESLAWSHYLASPRGEGDLATWREDLFEGEV